MVNEFDPMLEKLLLIEALIASMDVRIPTSAIIPKAIISTVRMVLKAWLLIACKEIFIFSDVVTNQK